MKRLLSALFSCLLAATFAWAAPRQASVTAVKSAHPRVHRHRPHKAGKHHHPNRHRRGV